MRDDVTRRRFVAAGAGAAVVGSAGCLGRKEDAFQQAITRRRTTGNVPGTSMDELIDLEGELTVYSGRSKGLVEPLLTHIDDRYDEFDLTVRFADPNALTNQLLEAGDDTRADVFYSVHAPGTLGALLEAGHIRALSSDTTGMVDPRYRSGEDWTGVSGRVRSVPYNTERISAGGIPNSIYEFPAVDRFRDDFGWDPVIPSYQASVTAMRVIDGEAATRGWLEAMLELNPTAYSGGFSTCKSIADGEVSVGLTNHYHPRRVALNRDDPPLGRAFTRNDPGTLFNVAGAAVLEAADSPALGEGFIRHLLSGEAQEYFAMAQTTEYPVVEAVPPHGSLPSREELSPPDIDFADLRDLEGTVELLKEYGLV
jgi:iron(III) transport system substrate-binding protein